MTKGQAVMNKRTLLVLAVLSFLIALLLIWFGLRPAYAEDDKCAAFDNWIGGKRFDYIVDAQDNWNLPNDAQLFSSMTFPKTGIWKYYSESHNSSYVIVFLSLEPTQPPGSRLGQHDICVYELPGLGMSQ